MARRVTPRQARQPSEVRATKKPQLRPHAFYPVGQRDQHGTPICGCGSLRTAAIHSTKERTDEQRAAEARRIGEAE